MNIIRMKTMKITDDTKEIEKAVMCMYCIADASIDDTLKTVAEAVTVVSDSPIVGEIFRIELCESILVTKKCSRNATDIKRIAEELRDIANSLDEKAKQVRTSESL